MSLVRDVVLEMSKTQLACDGLDFGRQTREPANLELGVAGELGRAVRAIAVARDHPDRLVAMVRAQPVGRLQREGLVRTELLGEVLDPVRVGAAERLDRGVGIAGQHQRTSRPAAGIESGEEMQEPLLHERKLLSVVDQDVTEPLVQSGTHVVVIRDQVGRVAQQGRVVDPGARTETHAVGFEESNDVGPCRSDGSESLELRVVEQALFGPDTEVHDLIDEPPVAQQMAVVRPVGFVLGREGVTNVPPLLGRSEQHRGLGVGEPVVVPADQVMREPMPRVDGNLDEGVEILVEEKSPGEPVLKPHLLGPVRHEEQDPIRGAVARAARPLASQTHETLLESHGLARARPPQ